jgi:hypothetical protein
MIKRLVIFVIKPANLKVIRRINHAEKDIREPMPDNRPARSPALKELP